MWGTKKNSPQSIGKAVCGLSTKIHTLVDSLGNPLKFILSAGNVHDSKIANDLIDGYKDCALLADRAYNSKSIIDKATAQNMTIVIPNKSNAVNVRPFDSHVYKSRHLIENFFQRLKVFRRIATRYEKLDSRFLGLIYLTSTIKLIH